MPVSTHPPPTFTTTLLGCLLGLAACDEHEQVYGAVALRSAEVLTDLEIQSVNGTYGEGCTARAGSWSLGVVPEALLEHEELSVVLNDSACTLTLTSLSGAQTLPASPALPIATAYQSESSAFMANDAVAFYVNAKLDATTFASGFELTLLVSDLPNHGTAGVQAQNDG
jgi:hypothetical protein